MIRSPVGEAIIEEKTGKKKAKKKKEAKANKKADSPAFHESK